jgi:ADP-ribosylglycohydrolase
MIQDRVAGALIGALIGDALGLGCHWYYDLEEMHRDHGDWINNYTEPKSHRYHAGMKAGQLSQSGLITVMLLRSVVENNEYLEDDFTQRLDAELFPLLDGTALQGPGGYTNQSIREAYQRRVRQKKPWNETGGNADTTEAAERAIVLAALYANTPGKVAEAAFSNCRLTQNDEIVVALSVAFNCSLALLIAGEKLDCALSEKLLDLIERGELPFQNPILPPRPGDLLLSLAGPFSVPDPLLIPSSMARMVQDSGIRIEPAWKVSFVYGMPCAIYHQIPAAFYLAARFADDFESAVLHAINGGGQNMSRAFLTGALVGAQVGLSNIPQRFITGLEKADELLDLASKLGKLAVKM